MTRKDAIEILEEVKTIDDSMFVYSQAYNDALDMAIEALKAKEPHWISVEDDLPQEHDTIFAKLYGTDKWRNGMFVKVSDDVRVVKVFRDGTKRVHHDHTVDGRWDSERKGLDVYGHVTHWMPNPELPDE